MVDSLRPSPLINDSRRSGAQSELMVAYRFVAASRVPAWPLVPINYDLLVDCGDAIQRVQVKTARQHQTGERWRVRLTQRRRHQDRPVLVSSIDYFCIVCDANRILVLPSTILKSPTDPLWVLARLDFNPNGERFQPYLNSFAIGQGVNESSRPAETVEPDIIRTPWYPHQRQQPVWAAPRKRHRRLSGVEVAELLQALGSTPTATEKRRLALQYGISIVSLRNYQLGRRKDLAGR